MSEKHTPGEWTVLEWEVDRGGTDWNVWGPKGSNHVTDDNLRGDYGSEADARLIAAAPDLLEALRGAIGALEFSRDYHMDLNNEEQAFAQDKLDAAHAAIAKAEGRS